jgi:NAD(P)H dehydrogenase (quinone)
VSQSSPAIFVTAAGGQLGGMVVKALLDVVAAERVIAGVRNASQVVSLERLGVAVRMADYEEPGTLDAAFADVDRVLLISSNTVGRRVQQHRHVVDAAKRTGVKLLAYTSILHADISPLGLAEEHRKTEAEIRASGVPFAFLRNGWYTENYAAAAKLSVEHGAVLGSAGSGRISSASRADYAAAAAAVLTARDVESGRIYELAGDDAYTLPQYAAELARQSGKPVVYRDLPETAYREALVGMGLPGDIAALLADSDVGASKDALFDDGRALGALIGRPTTPMAATVGEALRT